jgi:hypothetical protein
MVATANELKMSLNNVSRELLRVSVCLMADRAPKVTSLVVEASLCEKTGEIGSTFGIMLFK